MENQRRDNTICFTFLFTLILFIGGCRENMKTNHSLSFASDIAPIIHKNCTKCHIKGEAGPFSLFTYGDVKSKAARIKFMVSNRLMPPWPADPTYRHFAGELVLSDEEVETIISWIDKGMSPGDTATLSSPEQIKSALIAGKPDLIVKVPPIPIKGNNEDLFLVMKIPFELTSDTFIRAIEYVPGNRRLVHHVNTHLVQFDKEKKKNIYDGIPFLNTEKATTMAVHKELGILQDDGSYPAMTPSVSNYLPGNLFSFYPKEIGGYKATKKSAFYLNDMHFGPSKINAVDSSYYKIWFSKVAPKRPVSEFQLGTLGIAPVVPDLIIPADSIKTFHIHAVIPHDISLISVVPHMHLTGKKYQAYAVTAGGDTIPLIRINNWDFRWQYFYQFKTLLKIPRGSTIYVEGIFDNTALNPSNPFHPSREIRERNGSMKTTDEMFQLIITYVPYQAGDENLSLENAKP